MKTALNTLTRIIACTILVNLCFHYGIAQTSFQEISLQGKEYGVGFQHYTLTDSTRTYRIHKEFDNRSIHRPVPVSIWYPTAPKSQGGTPMTILNYLEVLKEEEEWPNLPNEFLLDWFSYLWNTPQNRAHLSEPVNAQRDADFAAGKFPVIVYAPSFQASSIENFALCEYLASNGYVVISSPSRGTETRFLQGGTLQDMETQSRDVEFLLKEIHRYESINPDRIALMGFSFGGLANTLTAMKNETIKLLISLDGTERYNYELLKGSAYFDLDKIDMPYVHFAQKKIPEEVMKEDKIPEELNYEFSLYDSLKYSPALSYRFHNLSHAYFSSFGVLFTTRDKRQDKTDAEIMASYKLLCTHTLEFLNEKWKNKPASDSKQAGESDSKLISRKTKTAVQREFNYRNFNDLARSRNFRELIPLYQETKLKYPQLYLEEGMLNTLGLRLSFDPKTWTEGINVFLLALHIYPESANLYDSLAEAYLYSEDIPNALKSFEKSLALNPANQNAVNKLKRLKN